MAYAEITLSLPIKLLFCIFLKVNVFEGSNKDVFSLNLLSFLLNHDICSILLSVALSLVISFV